MNLRFAFIVLSAVCGIAPAADTRADFLKLIDRPRVSLAPQVLPWVVAGPGIEKTSFSYMSEAGQRVTGLMFRKKPAAGDAVRQPAVIAMHATGDGKESMANLLRDLASKGFVGVAIDARYHGERAPGADGEDVYIAAILRTWRTRNAGQPGGEHPIFYDTAWDILRLVDFLETRPEVDAARIGAIGFSKGGMEAFYAAAADPRIAVVVPCLAVRSFAWELDHDMWQALALSLAGAVQGAARDSDEPRVTPDFLRSFLDRTAPGIYGEFDGPAMTPLIAPRPMLLINGEIDALTPVPGFMDAVHAAQRAYAAAGANERFVYEIEDNTGHKVTPQALQMGVDWLVRWLKQ